MNRRGRRGSALSPGPAPHQRDGARELDRLVGVEVVRRAPVCGLPRVVAEPDRAVGDDSWATTPERPLRISEMSRSTRRWSSIAANWPTDRRKRRVLGVGAEDPRIVGIAGADPGRLRHGADGTGNCLPWLVQRICRFSALCVRSAMFCLPQSMPSPQRVARQRQLRFLRQLLAGGHLVGERGRRVMQRACSAPCARRRSPALVGAGDAQPNGLRAVRRKLSV